MNNIPQKRCPVCKQFKPLTHENFYADKTSTDGFYAPCKACRNKRYAEKHPRQIIPDGYRRCAICKEVKPATREYFYPNKQSRYGVKGYCKQCWAKQYREKHPKQLVPEGYRQCSKCKECKPATSEYFTRAKEKWSYQCKKCRKASLDLTKYRIYNHNRRARKKSATGIHTAQDIQNQYQRQHGRCYYCKNRLGQKYHVDHIVPLSRGGTNWPDNLVIACPFCNDSKGDRLLHEWFDGGRLL